MSANSPIEFQKVSGDTTYTFFKDGGFTQRCFYMRSEARGMDCYDDYYSGTWKLQSPGIYQVHITWEQHDSSYGASQGHASDHTRIIDVSQL